MIQNLHLEKYTGVVPFLADPIVAESTTSVVKKISEVTFKK